MKNSLIIILVIVLLAIGGILYFFRDSIRPAYDSTSAEIQEKIVDINEDVSDEISDVREDVSERIAE